MKRVVFAVFLFFVSSAQAAKWLDQSHDIFLPPQVREHLSLYRDFPIFWWNFLVLDIRNGPVPWADITAACDAMVTSHRDLIAKSPCPAQWTAESPFLRDWIRSQVVRHSPSDLEKASAATLAKASLPLGRDLLGVLRIDPFGAIDELLGKAKSIPLALEDHQGFLFDPAKNRVVIPVQFRFPPQMASDMRALTTTAAGLSVPRLAAPAFWVGPHASTLENEIRVQSDLETVSLASFALFGLLGLFLFLTGRLRVLTLVPLLLVAIALTVGVTVWIFGSIHGIVLSFGPGIVGLAMDYGIHSAFMEPTSKRTWIANLLGLLTTGIVLVLMAFSRIPLMRELMVFSLVGLLFSFALFYALLHRSPAAFRVRPYAWTPWRSKTWGLLTVIAIAGLALVPFLNLNLDLRQMNFESPRTAELHKDLFRDGAMARPVFIEHATDDALEKSTEEKIWADAAGIAYQGPSRDIPPARDQARHFAAWKNVLCPAPSLKWTADEKKFFEPARALWPCGDFQPLSLEHPPAFVGDVHAGDRWLSLFFPKDDAQTRDVREKFPSSLVAAEVFASVPKILMAELLWMAPLSILGAWLILLLYYRSWRTSLLAVVPFLTGLGAYALISVFTAQPVTFVSLVGLIMIFGMSLDYGVFVVNFLGLKDPVSSGVWSALALSAAATLAGFVPLLFAHHPVLFQLGHALVWGTVGTCLGALFGLPWLAKRWSPA